MTIDEAIKHAEEVAEEKSNLAMRIRDNMKSEIALSNADECETCADEHRQLAEWLRELKSYKEQQPTNKCKGCYYNDGETHAECVVCDKKAQPSDEDCISREAMLSLQTEYAEKMGATTFWKLRDDIRAMPPVTPERPKGKWITQAYSMRITCTNCEKEIWYSGRNDYKYCPSCGAEMSGGEEDGDSN